MSIGLYWQDIIEFVYHRFQVGLSGMHFETGHIEEMASLLIMIKETNMNIKRQVRDGLRYYYYYYFVTYLEE